MKASESLSSNCVGREGEDTLKGELQTRETARGDARPADAGEECDTEVVGKEAEERGDTSLKSVVNIEHRLENLRRYKKSPAHIEYLLSPALPGSKVGGDGEGTLKRELKTRKAARGDARPTTDAEYRKSKEEFGNDG